MQNEMVGWGGGERTQPESNIKAGEDGEEEEMANGDKWNSLRTIQTGHTVAASS